jgi:hypothetical protein
MNETLGGMDAKPEPEAQGGEAACFTHLTCADCGVVQGEPHRADCTLAVDASIPPEASPDS